MDLWKEDKNMLKRFDVDSASEGKSWMIIIPLLQHLPWFTPPPHLQIM